MKAVIMAGGKGTRLRPLTCNTPKPMVPLLDRPVMEYTIDLLKKHGIKDIAITVQYMPEVIRQHFGDGQEFGVNIQYFEEETPLGTAGSVKNAESFLNETFIVISGDALTDFNLTEAIQFHRSKNAITTLVLTKVTNPLEYGVVMVDNEGEISRFLEKPSWGEVFSDTVNTGIYVVEPSVFSYYEKGREFDFSKDLFPLLMNRGKRLYGYIAAGYWSDIGNLIQYRQTQCDMLERKVDVRIKGQEVFPGVWIGENVKRGKDIFLNSPSFIGHHCTLEDHSWIGEYSVVGAGSILKYKSSIERTMLGKGCSIDHGAELKGATTGKNVMIGIGSLVSEGAVIGDGCVLGTKSNIQPGIKIWPNKQIENYATINHSFIWGERVPKNLFSHFGVVGSTSEVTTSFVHRLAIAYGSTIKQGQTIAVGHDSSPFARLQAKTFASGLHAAGIFTLDFGATTSSSTRFGTKQLSCSGSVHIRMYKHNGQDRVVIEFMDCNGLPIEKGTERKIENAYYQEDFRHVTQEYIGRKLSRSQVNTMYREALYSLVHCDDLSSRQFKVVLDSDSRNLTHIVPELLERLGCKLIQLNRFVDSPEELGEWVKLNKADFGIRMDENAQTISFVTNQGDIIGEENLFVLQTLLQLETTSLPLNVPVSAPNSVEILAMKYNRSVIRTKADMRAVMEGCQHEGFHIYYDAIYTLVLLMKYMALHNVSLAELQHSFPAYTLLKTQVECPFTEKGKVMRCLMEETKGKKVDLIDGIKIYHHGGWTLILPDNDEPMFKVFADAETPQIAQELVFTYEKKIVEYSSTEQKNKK